MSESAEAASVERFCAHDGCFRPAQEATGYCCDACNDADGDGLPPEHEKGCRRRVTLRPEDLRPIRELPYSDEFYAAIDAQDFELALSIRDRDRQAGRSPKDNR